MPIHGKVVRWYRSAFRDRDIAVSSDRGTHHFRFTKRHQQIAAGAAAGVSLWALVASTALVVNSVHSNQEIDDLEVGYANLIVDVNRRVQDAVAVSEGNARYAAQVAALQADRMDLLEELSAVAALAAATDAARQDLEDQRASLHDDVDRLRTDLLAANAETTALEQDLAQQGSELAVALLDRAAMGDTATILGDQIADLTARLDDAERRNEGLSVRVATLAETLALAYQDVAAAETESDSLIAELQRERAAGADLEALLRDTMSVAVNLSAERDQLTSQADGLRDRVAVLEWGLADRQVARQEAERVLNQVTLAAIDLSTQRNVQRDINGALLGQIGALETRFTSLATYQEETFAQLRDAIDEYVWAVEEGLAVTGLDIETLIEDIYGAEFYGTGGPYFPLLDQQIAGQPGWIDAIESIALTDRAVELRDVANQLPIGLPVASDVPLSSGFGPRRDPLNGGGAMHHGLDFDGDRGEPVHSTGPGTVIRADWYSGFGRTVEVDHGFGIITRYAHLQEILVEEGEPIGYSDQLGLMGSSGRTTGSHLHYEVLVNGIPHDPMNFIRAGEHVYEIATDQDNE